MTYQSFKDLPTEITEGVPEDAQHVFVAAFNSAESDGMDQEAATHVAWNTIKQSYQQDQSGQWQHKPEDSGIHNKSVTSGGN